MSQIIIEKLQKARERQVFAGGIGFTVRRPTDLEMIDINRDGMAQRDILRRFVLNWDAKEIDLLPGGTPKAVAFDAELFMEWVSDKPDCWAPLIEAIVDGYRQHQAQQEESLKKPENG